MSSENDFKEQFSEKIWPQLRRLIVFQLKLLIDIARDFVFAPLALIACIIDLIQQNNGRNSAFEWVMALGRSMEHKVDLFEQHREEGHPHSVDSIVDNLEEKLRRQRQSGEP